MSHTKQEEKTGIAILLDFRKAFDTIEWNYLRAALQVFNFGPDILNWFQVIYNKHRAVYCTMVMHRTPSFSSEVCDKVAHCLASFSSLVSNS